MLGRPLAEEGLENAFAIFGRDASPLVFHPQLQFAVLGDPSRHSNGGVWRRILDCVLKQVGQHTLHRAGIHPDPGQGCRHVKPQRTLSKQSADPVEPTFDEARWTGECELGARCLCAVRRVRRQERIHQLREPIRFHLDLREEFSAGVVVPIDVGSAEAAHKAFDVA
jgi:hypothetical protein